MCIVYEYLISKELEKELEKNKHTMVVEILLIHK
jgi:hypothetical protein